MKQIVRINLQEYLDRKFKICEQIDALKKQLSNVYSFIERGEILEELNEIDLGLPGIEEGLIQNHLIRLAKRAIELNDKEILDCLKDLCIIEEEEEEV